MVPRVLQQEHNEPDKGIQRVKALETNAGWVMVGFSQDSVADVYTTFSADTEESGDEFISFQDSLEPHLLIKHLEIKIKQLNHKKLRSHNKFLPD